MKQADAIKLIRQKENTREILRGWSGEAKMKTAAGEAEYICPLCGHGGGDDATGDGLVFNPKSKGGAGLKCFKCDFGGDVIDLYMRATGENFPRAVESLARRLGVLIDKEPRGDYRTGDVRDDFVASPVYTDKERAGEKQPDPEAEIIKKDIKDARAHINDPEARDFLRRRGLGLDKAGRIFAPAYNLGFTKNWRGHDAPRLLIPTGPCSYFLRDLRADADLTEIEKRNAKKDKGEKNIFNAQALLTGDPVFITEGEIDALSVIEVGGGLQAVGLGGLSEINKLLDFIRAHDVSCPLIVSLDTDEPGRKAAAKLCDALRKDGRRWILNNISGPFKDPNERLQKDRAGLARVIQNAAEIALAIPAPIKKEPAQNEPAEITEVPPPENGPAVSATEVKPPRPTLGLLSLENFVADLSAGSWLIDRWLPAGGLSMIFGDPGTFKSFFALDLALTLASRAGSWKGNPVRRLGDDERPVVVYLAGEGHAGLKARTLAWIKHYNETEKAAAELAGIPFTPVGPGSFDVFFSQRSLDLFNHGDAGVIIEEIKALGRPVEYIVVDTLARFFHGDENSAQDAGQLIGACGQLQAIFGAAVTLLHHSGVAADAKNRSRGSSAFLGALDTQIKLEIIQNNQTGGRKVICATQTKQKDVPEAPPLWLQPEPVALDDFVNPLTLETINSAVLVPHVLTPAEYDKTPAARNEPVENSPTDDDILNGRWG